MHYYGKYSGYLEERNIVPHLAEEGMESLSYGRPDYLAVNYYRTLYTSYLPADENNPTGS